MKSDALLDRGLRQDTGVLLQRRARIRLPRQQIMEQLWSGAVATSGNRWQMETPRKRHKRAETVATSCYQLPRGLDGKEGVDGSSPSEGLKKPLQMSGS